MDIKLLLLLNGTEGPVFMLLLTEGVGIRTKRMIDGL